MYLGDTGIYLSSIASGLADVDAITLSLAELSQDNHDLDLHTAARGIFLAAVSNTLVKGGIVLGMGSRVLRKIILPGLLATLATAIGVVFILYFHFTGAWVKIVCTFFENGWSVLQIKQIIL